MSSHHKDIPLHHRFIAGGVAGIAECLVMYPLDVVKTLSQLSEHAERRSTFRALFDLARERGLGTYRGIAAPLVMEAPKRAIKFTANDAYKRLLTPSGCELSLFRGALAGALAGFSEALVIVPFELVKIRMQAKENLGLYRGTWDCARGVLRDDGALGFYKGLESTLWRNGVWNGTYFGVIQLVRDAMPKADSETGAVLTSLAAGCLAGTFATAFNTPFDVVKSRIQQQDVAFRQHGTPIKYRWALPGLVDIARKEGAKALYKGFVPKVLRLGPGGGILLVVFDAVSKFLQTMN